MDSTQNFEQSAKPGRRHSPIERIGNAFALVGVVAFLLPALAAFGINAPLEAARKALGAFAEPGMLLIVFLGAFLLAAVFGTVKRAIPVVSGLIFGLLIFAGAFDMPKLEAVREALFRFAAFTNPGPALFAGAAAVLAGNLTGRMVRVHALPGFLVPPVLGLAVLLTLAAVDPFPEDQGLRLDSSSVESALGSVASLLGAEYRRPDVEEAVRRVVEEKDATLAEKEQALRDLTERLRRSESDKEALGNSVKDSKTLASELEAARKSLEEIKGRVERDTPPVAGGRYDQAVQPTDPVVRDFAVKAASAAPGAWDNPQGSRLPNAAGARQLVLVHAAISSNWKYVSDPAVSWMDFTSPARRSLALGMAGDCDDYATVMASCIIAVGGKARIVHGIKGNNAHAWAEVWIGSGAMADSVLSAVARAAGRSAVSLAATRNSASGDRWLVLDWKMGEYSFKSERIEVAWKGDL